MKVNLIEVLPDNCRGCRLCEMACSFKHEQECSTAKSRIRILKDSKWAFDVPLLCIHCAEAPCIETCAAGALARDEVTGAVVADALSCVGCGDCVSACPLQALFLDGDQGTVFKCDLCGGDPECVKWCSNEALIFKEVDLDSPERKAFLDKATHCLQTVGCTKPIMKISVEFVGFPDVVSAIGQNKLEMEAGGTIEDLLHTLVDRYGRKVRDSFYDSDGVFDFNTQVILNGEEFLSVDRHDRPLHEGDEVMFLLALSGG